MNVFFSDLFLKIARKLGFELQPKQIIENDFFTTTDISITSIMADRLATLIVADSDIDINGTDKVKVLIDIAKKYLIPFLISLSTDSAYFLTRSSNCLDSNRNYYPFIVDGSLWP